MKTKQQLIEELMLNTDEYNTKEQISRFVCYDLRNSVENLSNYVKAENDSADLKVFTFVALNTLIKQCQYFAEELDKEIVKMGKDEFYRRLRKYTPKQKVK